jgi:hypothetical protein
VKDILFNEDVPYSEDWLFNRKYFEKIKSVTVVPEKWYIYYLHNESATHKRPATNYIKNYLPFWDEWYKLDMNVLDAIYLKELYMRNVHSFFAFISIQVLNDTEKFKQKRKIMKEANNHPMFDNNYYKVKLKDVEGIGEKLRFICVRYRMILLSYFLVSVKKKKWRLI